MEKGNYSDHFSQTYIVSQDAESWCSRLASLDAEVVMSRFQKQQTYFIISDQFISYHSQ